MRTPMTIPDADTDTDPGLTPLDITAVDPLDMWLSCMPIVSEDPIHINFEIFISNHIAMDLDADLSGQLSITEPGGTALIPKTFSVTPASFVVPAMGSASLSASKDALHDASGAECASCGQPYELTIVANADGFGFESATWTTSGTSLMCAY